LGKQSVQVPPSGKPLDTLLGKQPVQVLPSGKPLDKPLDKLSDKQSVPVWVS
jgi:hypothetical protein